MKKLLGAFFAVGLLFGLGTGTASAIDDHDLIVGYVTDASQAGNGHEGHSWADLQDNLGQYLDDPFGINTRVTYFYAAEGAIDTDFGTWTGMLNGRDNAILQFQFDGFDADLRFRPLQEDYRVDYMGHRVWADSIVGLGGALESRILHAHLDSGMSAEAASAAAASDSFVRFLLEGHMDEAADSVNEALGL